MRERHELGGGVAVAEGVRDDDGVGDKVIDGVSDSVASAAEPFSGPTTTVEYAVASPSKSMRSVRRGAARAAVDVAIVTRRSAAR